MKQETLHLETGAPTRTAGALGMTSGRLLAKNAVWNLLGRASPLLVAVWVIPILIRELGTDRFGILTLAWSTIGYLSIFDLGLGRALTQLVATRLGQGKHLELPEVIGLSLLLLAALGLVGCLAGTSLTPILATRFLKVPPALQAETVGSFYLLSLSIPVIILYSALKGVLAAQQRFGAINSVLVPLGISNFLGPLAVLHFTKDIAWVVATLPLSMALACGVHWYQCRALMPSAGQMFPFKPSLVAPLLRFGGWLTVSNILSPIMSTMDRFFIGAFISVSAVAYYSTPHELILKMLIVPTSIVGVLFPAFSSGFTQSKRGTAQLFKRADKYMFLILFPVTLALAIFAREGLTLWLKGDFAAQAARVLQWLSIGALFNGLAYIPFSLVQSSGRPDITAKLHMIELPIYLAAFYLSVTHFGIQGAAMAWSLRVTLDCLFLYLYSYRLLALPASAFRGMLACGAAAGLVLALAMLFPSGLAVKAALFVAILAGFLTFFWTGLLTAEERAEALSSLRLGETRTESRGF
jgi:O-antigen/teichoic acid export membrane protein